MFCQIGDELEPRNCGKITIKIFLLYISFAGNMQEIKVKLYYYTHICMGENIPSKKCFENQS